jgi:hypothetical protein
MSSGDNCGTCGGKHPKGKCPMEPRAPGAPDVELQAVFSGRKGVVALEEEGTEGPGAAPESSSATQAEAPPEIEPVRAPGAAGVVSIETLIAHPDPFISSLASQLRARDSMLEAVRRAAQLAVEQSRKREKDLDERDVRIRDLEEQLRKREAEISSRERMLEERVSKVDTEVADRMRFVREWEAELEKRELELAAGREELERDRRERILDVAGRGEDRSLDIESFGRSPSPHNAPPPERPEVAAQEGGDIAMPVGFAETGPGQGAGQPEFVGMTAAAKTKEGAAAELLKLRSDLRRERARVTEREESMLRKERELEEKALKLAEREARLHDAEQKWDRRVLRKEAREP